MGKMAYDGILRMRTLSKEFPKGFSLVEILIASGIFLLAFVGILMSYLTCLDLAQFSKNTSIAVRAVQGRMETIRNTPVNQIKATYDRVTFATSGLTGIGVSYVDDTNPSLLTVTITFCWKQPNGRIVGEDTNLNGVLDTGEDKNSNSILDSPAQIVTKVFN